MFLNLLNRRRTLFPLLAAALFFETVLGQTERPSAYLSKLLLPNDTVKHSNEAVLLFHGSDSSFYFSQKAAPTHRVAEFHLFSYQKKVAQEIKIPFSKELQIERLLFVDQENKTLFFTCAVNGDDIYYSQLISGKWQKPLPFAALNSPFRESGMCISPDKKRIVFASARNNPAQLDLFSVEYQEDGLWRKPQLIARLSSSQEEDDPRFSPDGKTLYFASKGFKSRGKYDLFKSTYEVSTKSWTEPNNLGPSVNSEFNEVSPALNTKGSLAFFSSDRYAKPDDYNVYRPISEKKVAFILKVNDADSALQIGNLVVRWAPEDAMVGDGGGPVGSETGSYIDSLFLNRWYLLTIMDGEKFLVTERLRFSATSSRSKSYYLDLSRIKDPYLIYQGKKIPLLTKYVLRYEKDETLPNKHNQKTLERAAELLGHLHIYHVEIQYPSNLPKDQQALVATRVDRLQKYLLKNKASETDIVLSKQNTTEPDQLTLKMEFKPKVH